MKASTGSGVRVWDLPTRSFHWLLVLAFAVAMLSAGQAQHLDIHVFAGYVIFVLLLFRLLWGVMGTRHARFTSFVHRPVVVLGYLQALRAGTLGHTPGHNPAGGWAIVLMLVLLSLITLSGLVVLGGEEKHGPLAGWFSIDSGVRLHAMHEVLAWTMVVLIVVHVLGVLSESRLLHTNLVAAMWHGRKGGVSPVRGVSEYRLLGWILPLMVLVAAALNFRGWYLQDSEHPYLPFQGPALSESTQWQDECGSCHLAFHPSLLPARSWQRMLEQQDAHFGDDLALSEQTIHSLLEYAGANAAELGATEAAWRIAHSIAPQDAPLRITETAYWMQTHEAIASSVWSNSQVGSKANCTACHQDAEAGTFNDSAMHLPPLASGKEEITS